MTSGSRAGRLGALLLFPLTAVVVPTLIVRPLLAPEMRTAWPIFAGALTITSFAFVATTASRWTHSRAAAAVVTLASVGTTLGGFYLLLLWALTSTWG
jgi:hypothetical protein